MSKKLSTEEFDYIEYLINNDIKYLKKQRMKGCTTSKSLILRSKKLIEKVRKM